MFTSLNKRTQDILIPSLLNLAISLLLGLLCYNRGSLDGFLSVIVPVLVVAEAAIIYSVWFKCDMVLCMTGIMLFEVGTMLQVMLDGADEQRSISLIAPAFAIICIIAYTQFSKINFTKNRNAYIILIAAGLLCIAIIAFLRIHNRPINGTYAWIVIGGEGSKRTFQLTEFLKLLFVIFHAVLFSSKIKFKWIWSAVLALIMFVGLLVLNELGTLIIIFAIWLIFAFLFFDSPRIMLSYLGSTALLGTIAFLVCMAVNKRVETLTTLGESVSTVQALLAKIYNKICDRVLLWLKPELFDPRVEAYQSICAREAVIRGGWLGTTETISVPVEESDFIFTALLLRCGVIFGIVVVALFSLMLWRGISNYLSRKNTFDTVIMAGCTFMLVLPAYLMFMGSTDYFVLTGVAVPFLSRGGVNMCLSFLCIMMLLWSSGRKPDIVNQLLNKYKPSRKAFTKFKR